MCQCEKRPYFVPITRVGMVNLCTVPVFIQTQFGAISQTEPAAKITKVAFRRFGCRSLTLKINQG